MISNRRLILPYAAPFMAYAGIASFSGDVVSEEVDYLLRIICSTALLVWAWKWYMPLGGPRSWSGSVFWGIGAGFLGIVFWILLLIPFTEAEAGEPYSTTAFVLRLLAAGLLVPFLEEILMRGFVFRLAHQWWLERKNGEDEALAIALDEKNVADVTPGEYSWAAVVVSTLAFASGHLPYEWPAAICFGVLMSGLWIVRKDLLSCIVAHGAANVFLALYVLQTGKWYLW